MSDQSQSWYVAAGGDRPLGPLTEIQVCESLRVGNFNETTLCWREGMSKWLALGQVEAFASAKAASVPPPRPAVAARSTAPRTGTPPSRSPGSRPGGRRHSQPAWIGWAIAGGIAAICALVAGVVFLLNAGATNWGSSYTADYKVVSEGGFDARLKTTVKGPAAKLAVILTDPKGESDTQIIEKESMISNSQTVELPMRNLREGTYVLAVKTVEPEKVVWQKKIPLSLGQLAVGEVKLDLAPNLGQFEGYQLQAVNLVLNKDGSLPVKFADVSVAVDGNDCSQKSIRSGCVMADQQQTISIFVYCNPTPEMMKRDRARGGSPYLMALFRPGERHLVKGKLLFGEDGKSLEFEKEFMVPQGKKIGVAEASVRAPSPGAMPSREGPQISLSEPVKPEPSLLGKSSAMSERTTETSEPTSEPPSKAGELGKALADEAIAHWRKSLDPRLLPPQQAKEREQSRGAFERAKRRFADAAAGFHELLGGQQNRSKSAEIRALWRDARFKAILCDYYIAHVMDTNTNAEDSALLKRVSKEFDAIYQVARGTEMGMRARLAGQGGNGTWQRRTGPGNLR